MPYSSSGSLLKLINSLSSYGMSPALIAHSSTQNIDFRRKILSCRNPPKPAQASFLPEYKLCFSFNTRRCGSFSVLARDHLWVQHLLNSGVSDLEEICIWIRPFVRAPHLVSFTSFEHSSFGSSHRLLDKLDWK